METTLSEAAALLMKRFETITVADLAVDFEAALAERRASSEKVCPA
jgi:hypothetical protein